MLIYDGSETKIKTVNFEDNVVAVCVNLQKVKPFAEYKKSLDLDLSGIASLGRIAIAWFHKNPPSLVEIRELRRVTTNNESLFLYLSDLLEDYKK